MITVKDRLRIGGLFVDRVTFDAALGVIATLVEARRGGMVFTPNVDHVVLAAENPRFRSAYAACDLSLADGTPIVWASRALGQPVPEKISGSDLAPRLLALAEARGFRVYLLGGTPQVAAEAALRVQRRYPDLAMVGYAAPTIDLAGTQAERQAVIEAINLTRPDLILVCLGAPKQELWIHESASALRPAVLLGVGAVIDFLAGRRRRAPRWISRAGLEWAYRLVHEPRRLWRRYLVRDPKFLGIFLRELWLVRGPTRLAREMRP